MHINANISVELDEDQADEVLLNILKRDYVRLYDERQDLMQRVNELAEYEKEDLEHINGYIVAIETLLKYYMYVGDAEEFIRGVKGVYISE
jgi:hypothetical protein